MQPLRIHYFEHVPFEGLGCIEDWARQHGHTITATRWHTPSAVLPDLLSVDWLIVMGGPMGVYETGRYIWLPSEQEYIAAAIQQNKKVLGICLGAQLIAASLGARVYPNKEKEIGWFPVQFSTEGPAAALAGILPPELMVFHWHGDTFDLPAQATRFATTAACANQGFIYGNNVIGLQFHLEVRRSDVLKMVQYGGGELTPAGCIQSAEEIAERSSLADTANETMFALLDYMAGER